jgi:AcrR family transcriptional regulator
VSGDIPPRLGRPPLTERRKAATRLDIAHEAVRLFTTHGVAATSAEDIAAAAGVSVRTLWRYCSTKESCVLPLLNTGVEFAARCLRAWPSGRGVDGLLRELEESSNELVTDVHTLLNLVRLTRTEPGLRAVWLQAHDDAEPVFAVVLAQRAGLPADALSVRVQAAMINVALRVAVEHHALQADTEDVATVEAVRAALLTVAQGLPD